MIEFSAGRLKAGLYEYADGKRFGLWPGSETFAGRRCRTRSTACCRRGAGNPEDASTRGADADGRQMARSRHRLPAVDRWQCPVHRRLLRPPAPVSGFRARA